MKNIHEFKTLVEEKATAQKRAAILSAKRRRVAGAGIASLALAIAILLPTFGMLYPTAPSEETGAPLTENMSSLLEKHEIQSTAKPPFLGINPDTESEGVPEKEPSTSEPLPNPPFSDESSALSPFDKPLKGLTAINRLEGLTAQAVAERKVDKAFTDAYLNFALTLFKDANGVKNSENLCFSPLSIMLALAVTANGADGITLAEMEDFLGGELSIEELNATLRTWMNKMQNRSYSISVLNAANSIWVRQGAFNPTPAFLQTVADHYRTALFEAPFDDSTVEDVNLWISYHTGGMIEKMLTEIQEDTMMYIINTLYLDAVWATKYRDSQLSDGVFHGVNGDSDATMMYEEMNAYLSMEGASGFYKAMDGYAFYAILPDEGVEIDEFVASLTAEKIRAFCGSGIRAEVHTYLPSFSYDSSIDFTKILESYIPTALSPLLADFHKMRTTDDGDTLYVGSVQQNTSIKVGQNGIAAAAGTIIELPTYGDGPSEALPVYHITLDRPFVYLIVDELTNLPIFIGVVEQL